MKRVRETVAELLESAAARLEQLAGRVRPDIDVEQPAVYYVPPYVFVSDDGDDAQDGSRPATAVRTMARAVVLAVMRKASVIQLRRQGMTVSALRSPACADEVSGGDV